MWKYFVFAVGVLSAQDFTRDVQPIFAKRCQGCHGPAQQMAGVRFDDPEAVLKGGYSGPIVVPGKSAESKLIARVSSDKKGFFMPPVGERLSAAEIGVLTAWIDQGAKVPAQSAKAAPSKSTPWSFQPIRRVTPPDVRNRAWVRNPIDNFVLAKLEAEGVEPSLEANKTALIRRLSLDLIGLPPTPREVEDFVTDNRADAYERLVDRLLASPHYGEKWTRLWLDLAHYADSDGYEKDLVRPWAWRYRNWVIEAINSDMGYDRFTIEQLAGDLLPNATVEQRVATGFQRTVLVNREAGVDRKEDRFEQTVNRANTVGTVWLGLTVGCAQCHNHKFDPILQKDYYQLTAFFNNVEEADIDAPLPGEIGGYLRARPQYDRDRAEILKKYDIAELQTQWEPHMREAIDHPGANLEWDFSVTSFRAMVDSAAKLIQTDPAKRTIRQQDTLTNYFVRNPGPEFAKDKDLLASLKEARAALEKLDASFTPLTQAMTIAESATPVPTHIALRGDFRSPGIEVPPGTLSALPPLKVSGTPTRLDLAHWLVSPENPLTARVAVNRYWQELFGRGLVRTSEDFGMQGEKPTHPELLDWLATEFRDHGWSRKYILKTIVMSAAYRQSSHARKELLTRDPDNSLLARQVRLRLPAELLRDSALEASGLLDDEIGGRSVRPPLPPGIAELGYANSVKWKEDTGKERYRRGLYIHYQRTTPYPQLTNFDAPESVVACTRRERSNTPLQALNLLNDPVFLEAAQGLALRILKEAPADESSRIDFAFNVCLGRKPNEREKERIAKYFDEQAGIFEKDRDSAAKLFSTPLEGVDPVKAAAWVGVSRVMLNLDEFINRE
jgi:hypothetical protein